MNPCHPWTEATVRSIRVRVPVRRDVTAVAPTPGETAPAACGPDTPRRLSALASVCLLLSEKDEIVVPEQTFP